MAEISWANPVNGYFSTASDWTGGVVPGSGDDALLNALDGSPYIVTEFGGSETVSSVQTAANSELKIFEGKFTSLNGTGTGVNAGTFLVEGDTYLGGVFDNAGSIDLTGAPVVVASKGLTLTGHGAISFQNGTQGGEIETYSPANLINASNTIFGSGGIGRIGNYELSFTNQVGGIVAFSGNYEALISCSSVVNYGLVKSVEKSGVLVSESGVFSNDGTVNNQASLMSFFDEFGHPISVVNTGLIEATASGSVLFDDGSVTNTGVILAGTGDQVQFKQVTVSGAGTINAAGGSVLLQGADISGGTLKSAGGAAIHVQSGTDVLDGTANQVSLTGALIINNAASLTAQGTIANTGAITVNSAGATTTLIVGAAGLTLTGKGHVLLSNNAANVISGGVLTNAGNLIFGAGDIGNGAMSLINQGTIDATDATALIVDTGANTIVNSGTIVAVTGGVGQVMSAVANTGLIYANGGSLTVNGAVSGTGRVNIKAGTLTMASSFNEIVSFIGTTGELALAQSQGFSNLVYGFSKTGATSLDLEDIAFGGSTAASFSGTTKGGILTVTDGTHTASIHLQGDYTASTFTVSSDGHGGTSVVDPPAGAGPLLQAMAGFRLAPASGLAGRPEVRSLGLAMLHAQT